MGSDASEYPGFFVLKPARGSDHDTDFVDEGDHVGEAPRCPQCGATVGMRLWLPPYRGTLELLGTRFADLVVGPGNGVLLSERMAGPFRSEGLTGLEGFHPVEVRVRRNRRSSKAEQTPGYLYALPSYGGAAVDEARSRIRRTAPPRNCSHCRASGADSIHGFALEPDWRVALGEFLDAFYWRWPDRPEDRRGTGSQVADACASHWAGPAHYPCHRDWDGRHSRGHNQLWSSSRRA